MSTRSQCKADVTLPGAPCHHQITGKHVVYNEVSEGVFRSVPGRKQISDLCEVIVKRNERFRLSRAAPTPARKKLKMKVMTFEEWARKNKQIFKGEDWEQLD